MNSKRIVTTGVLALAALVAGAIDVRAQQVSSFTDLPSVIELGQRVIVREDDGRVSRGKVVSLEDDRVEIQWRRWIFAHRERTLTSATVESIKVQDPDWNGMLLGAGAGFLAGWLLVDNQCGRDLCVTPLGRIVGAQLGAMVGSLIDQSINPVVYDSAARNRVRLAPVVGAHRIGFTATATF